MALYGQEIPVEEGALLSTGKSATLGLEASTAFAWDINNNSTGLETKVGMDLVFPLFPKADRGLYPENFDEPAVRIALKNASFTWWNTYSTKGGNYEQDSFNSWTARPLVLTFDTFAADLVWTNYFFRVASSTTAMQTDQSTLFSIFDEVMDAGERWYYRRSATRALWHTERYNIQQFPLLKEKIFRDYIDDDYRSSISGILALGAEFDKFSAAIKAASHKNGIDNNDNAWLFGVDMEFVPLENILITLTGFYGLNFEKNTGETAGRNPLNFGSSIEYRFDLSDRYILTPKLGYDFATDTISNESAWELSGGFLLYTRGYNYLTSSRILDWDNVIPIGASASLSMTDDSTLSAMVSWFEPAGNDSMLTNFGGFLQLELANLLGVNDSTSAFAMLAQLEYIIAEKFTPYVRGGYMTEFQDDSSILTTGSYLVKAALGFYITPVHFFSVDIRYEMDTILLNGGGTEPGKSLFYTVFTIRM
jgi:hypothetical protein